ncbi:hypothetical protein M431DRAFT_554373 [Trichoderma harzianum CBS 226.95]|uniref:Uncharacterized protein n=1 Tax=Trichoderma harzianum CBS 226.95 TaxID=983964 RepID=A0A2T4ADM7_TRIHA|nr:hypothetical protein M431DRAFT_554373 [Trichoderma harzianum CBS 226.95]PTB55194.1 hypothetical protein M431DRAFT_554373 [Trichoderma harzianum CBS 226.95]
MLSRQTLVSSAVSRENEAQRVKGGGKMRSEGEGQPPCSQSFMSSNRSLLFLLLHGRRGPQIANPLSTASFSRLSGRRGGGQGMGVPYSAGAVIRETRPKMQAKKADQKEECQQERRQGHRSGNARKCASRTLARASSTAASESTVFRRLKVYGTRWQIDLLS